MWWAETVGYNHVFRQLDSWWKQYALPVFCPSPYLQKMAKNDSDL
jgi:hypothetical protein